MSLPFLAMAAVLLASSPPSITAQDRPDIVVILADDMGYSDLGCYGGEIPTPRIDALAEKGVRFTDFYNTARCCPTRASLLTGLYPHQAGVGHMMDDRGHDGYRGDLAEDSVTVAEVLRDHGYATALCGKWHVTRQVGEWTGEAGSMDRRNFPRQRGFERFFGTIHGAGSFFDPISLMRDDKAIATPGPVDGKPFHYTDALAEEAVRIVAEEREQPLFLYLSFTAPHWPLHARPEDIEAQRGRYAAGWDEARYARLRRMKELDILGEEVRLTPRDRRVPAWEEAEHKEWEQRRMEVYAAQVTQMDRAVGRVVDALETAGRLDNTLILFLADNGGCAEELSSGWGGLHIPQKTRTGGAVRIGNEPDVMPGPEATYQSYGVPWANVSNTPFRLYKHFVHEGGIASPLIVHWPAKVLDHGALRDTPGHVVDVLATCLDAAGATYPTRVGERDVQETEGVSLLPAAIADGGDRGRALFWEHEGNRAVRRGRFKLVARGAKGPWELYDLARDRMETVDLAGERATLLDELTTLWEAWAERCQVVPGGAFGDR